MTCFDGIACGRMLMVAATLGGSLATAQAAAPLYWPGGNDGYDRPLYDPSYEQPRRRVISQPRMPKDEAIKAELAAKGSRKPTGPLVMTISLERQTMKVYDANGFFAESPISSGMKGHTTPMGVFSVIQKNKWHRSNIYSAAPMPFMQRLTWSGIALHAGVVPGYPASHGCVRMPMNFAVKMWRWTRMGARVVIVPGEISPDAFTHPLLASIKTAPTPVAATTDIAPAVVTTKTADASNTLAASASVQPATSKPMALAGTKDAQPAAEPPVADKAAADKPPIADAAAKRTGPIAIFVSRKDAKLYVRQNFAPIFDVPVAIVGDQPLGTHVFTAYAAKDVGNPMQWTALTLPASARMTDESAVSHRRQSIGAVIPTPPIVRSTATEALDRLKLPEDVLARIGEDLKAGSSFVISDQGLGASGETGLGTDFIMRLRD